MASRGHGQEDPEDFAVAWIDKGAGKGDEGGRRMDML